MARKRRKEKTARKSKVRRNLKQPLRKIRKRRLLPQKKRKITRMKKVAKMTVVVATSRTIWPSSLSISIRD